MPRTSKPSPQPQVTDHTPAEAFERTASLRASLREEALIALPADARPSLDAARALAADLDEVEVQDRFARLPGELFDAAVLARFRDVIAAYEHARASLDAAVDARGEVLLDEALAARANELRTRMLKVVIHYFEDDDRYAADVRALGRRRGHPNLAADLSKLAELYDAEREVVARDPKYWRDADAEDARAVSGEIDGLLRAARGDAERRWGDELARAWTVLARDHDELAHTASWLFRRAPREGRFSPRPIPPKKRGPRVKPAADAA